MRTRADGTRGLGWLLGTAAPHQSTPTHLRTWCLPLARGAGRAPCYFSTLHFACALWHGMLHDTHRMHAVYVAGAPGAAGVEPEARRPPLSAPSCLHSPWECQQSSFPPFVCARLLPHAAAVWPPATAHTLQGFWGRPGAGASGAAPLPDQPSPREHRTCMTLSPACPCRPACPAAAQAHAPPTCCITESPSFTL
jgi:hypothetical protein